MKQIHSIIISVHKQSVWLIIKEIAFLVLKQNEKCTMGILELESGYAFC